jgi:hypothetical protein
MKTLIVAGVTLAVAITRALLADEQGNARDDKLPQWVMNLLSR